MNEYTVTTLGGMELTMLLDEDEAKARGAKPVQAKPAEPQAEPAAKAAAPANKSRTGQVKA